MGLFRKRHLEVRSQFTATATATATSSVPNAPDHDPFALLKPSTRRQLRDGPQTLAALAPVLATSAGEHDEIVAFADDLALPLCLPSDVIDQAFGYGVDALLAGLTVDRDHLSFEFEDWLQLALAEGWRIGRRLLGTDERAYVYEDLLLDRRLAEVPEDIIFDFTTFFAQLKPLRIVEALGDDFERVVGAVVDTLCSCEAATWFPKTMPARRPLYRAAVAAGIALAIAEHEILAARYSDGPEATPAVLRESPRDVANSVARATLEAASSVLQAHGYLAKYDDGSTRGSAPAVAFESDAARPCSIALAPGSGGEHVALEIRSSPGPQALDFMFEDLTSPLGAHATLDAYYPRCEARAGDGSAGSESDPTTTPPNSSASLWRRPRSRSPRSTTAMKQPERPGYPPAVLRIPSTCSRRQIFVTHCRATSRSARTLTARTARWESSGAAVQRRGEFLRVVAGPSYRGVELAVAVNVLYDDHPAWGHGLAVRAESLTFHSPDRTVAAEVLRILADVEWDGSDLVGELEADSLGSWFLSPDDEAFYVTFVPEAACYPGIATRLVDGAIAWIAWINEYGRKESSYL